MMKIVLSIIFLMSSIYAFESSNEYSSLKSVKNSFTEKPKYLLRPSINARPGVLNVFSADTFGKGTFSFGYHGQYHEDINVPFDGENQYYQEHLGASWSPTKYLELFIERVSTININDAYSYSNYNNYFGYMGYANSSELSLSLGDLTFGGKVTLPISPSFRLAVEGSVLTFTDIVNTSPFVGTSYGIKGLATMNLGKHLFNYGNTLLLHLNYEYFINNSYDVIEESGIYDYRALGISRYDRMNYGAALELQAGALNPFIEWTLSQPLSSSLSFFEYPSVITLGTKINPDKERRLSLNLAVDLGLTREDPIDIERTPRYKFSFGIAYIIGGKRKMSVSKVSSTDTEDLAIMEKVVLNKSETPDIEKIKFEVKQELKHELSLEADEVEMKKTIEKAQDLEIKEEKLPNIVAVSEKTPAKINEKEASASEDTKNESVKALPNASPLIYFVTLPNSQNVDSSGTVNPQVKLLNPQRSNKKPAKTLKPKATAKKIKPESELVEEITTTTTRKIYKNKSSEEPSSEKETDDKSLLKSDDNFSTTSKNDNVPKVLPVETKSSIVEEIEKRASTIKQELKELKEQENELIAEDLQSETDELFEYEDESFEEEDLSI